MTSPVLPYLVLFTIGAGWGLSVPLSKIAVSTGYQPYGLIFWQLVVVVAVLAPLALSRRRSTPLGWVHLRLFAIVAVTGAVVPDLFFYMAAAKLQGGIMAILVSSVPLFSLPIALALGNDQFSWVRLVGICLGVSGIVLMIAPKASLPDPTVMIFALVALIAPALYALEGNIVAKWGTYGLDAVQTIFGASAVGLLLAGPIAIGSGQWINPIRPWGAAEFALIGAAALHGLAYAGHVWLVGRAGSVFASQTACIVTAFGVIWSMLLLAETYTVFVWLALPLMLLGIFLVQPRR